MVVSERTRKILWVQSGGRCAICCRQVLNPGTETDDPSVFGEEAHIVGRGPGGPRAGGLDDDRIDHHSNLLLLCSEHHKQIDDQVNEFPVTRLREIKRSHQQRIAQLGEPGPELASAARAGLNNSTVHAATTAAAHWSAPMVGAVPVAEADPRLLGVHRAIHVAGAPPDTLPAYVERDTDLDGRTGLRARLAAAARSGAFVLVIGSSSTGKTRCLHEALRDVLPDWWLVHPGGPDEVRDLAQACPTRVVVWLDEFQQYLRGADGLDSGTVRRLLGADGPVVIVGTLWPTYYAEFTARPLLGAPDLRERERSVIELAEVVTMPEQFTPAELARAAQSADPRVQAVLRFADYGFTQAMAAAPQLMERWEHADAHARAVMSVVLDAARLGVRSPIPAAVLRSAAPGYCDDRARARADPGTWFERAVSYATKELNGAASVLAPVAAPDTAMGEIAGYQIADFLLDRLGPARRRAEIPSTFWKACRLLGPSDARRLGEAAENRLRYGPAARLYARACEDVTDVHAAERLARLYENAGRHADAADVLWPACRVNAGNLLVYVTTGVALAANMAEAGRLDWLVAQAEAGDDIAAEWLADALAERGEEEALLGRTRAGDGHAADRLAALWMETGRDAEAQELLRSFAATGVGGAALRLAEFLVAQGKPAEAIEVLSPAAGAGDVFAMHRLGELLADAGRSAEACAAVHRLVLEDDPSAVELWVDVLARDDFDGTLALLREAADEGNQSAVRELARLLAGADRLDEALGTLRATEGGRARHQLVELLQGAGRYAEALAAARTMAETRDAFAPQILAGLLAETGAHAELAERADAGDGHAAVALARIWTADGRDTEATALLRSVATSGNSVAACGWVKHLSALGRPQEADRLHRYGLTPNGQIATDLDLPKVHRNRRAAAARELAQERPD
jgi:hypothetical protein